MGQICLPAGCVDAVRFSLIDACTGEAVAGASNGYIATCIKDVTLTPNVTEGDETILETNCGTKCWQTRKNDRLDNITVEMTLLNPDYYLQSLINGVTLLSDATPDEIGYIQDENAVAPWLSVEIFEQVPSEACDSSGINYRRLVLLKTRFQPVTFEAEDPFRLVKLTGVTAPTDVSGWASGGGGTGVAGPFNDFPLDLTGSTARSQYIEVQETLGAALTGTCGYTAVPAGTP